MKIAKRAFAVFATALLLIGNNAQAPVSRITNLKVDSIGGTVVNLSWTSPSSTLPLSAYDLRMSSIGPINALNFLRQTPLPLPAPAVSGTRELLSVESLRQGTLYYFAIKTRDTSGQWSLVSNLAWTLTLGLERPVTIAWDASSNPNLGGYKVYYGTTPGVYGPAINVGNRTSWTLTNLVYGVNYYFYVGVYTKTGAETPFTNELTVQGNSQETFSYMASKPVSQQVSLYWDPNTEPDLGGYILYYWINQLSTNTQKISATSTNTTVPGLLQGQTYFFYLTATNTSGLESDPSNMVMYQVPAH